VYDVALKSLQMIAAQKELYGNMMPLGSNIGTNTGYSISDYQVLKDFNNFKNDRKNGWPPRRGALKQFLIPHMLPSKILVHRQYISGWIPR
jgi:hypothetical protein